MASNKRIRKHHPRQSIYFIIWSVIFGAGLAIGGTLLEPFQIPLMNITAASPYVALMITLNKLVVFKRFSVTYMYLIAGIIAIFTTYLGPPTILKPVYVLAGLSFDAFSMFRTYNLRFWNLIYGHLAITVTGFGLFWMIFSIMVPGSSELVLKALWIAGPVHFAVSLIVAYIVFRLISPNNPPVVVQNIRSQLE